MKHTERSNFGGKQMQTNPAKEGHNADVYFSKKWPWISDGDKFSDRIRYADTQKEKKKGFLSGDYKRRDEFSNTIRTEQYRELLTQEAEHSKKALEVVASAYDDGVVEEAETAADAKRRMHRQMYDSVFDERDLKQETATRDRLHVSEEDKQLQKLKKQTQNPTNLSKEREYGSYRTSTMLIGSTSDTADYEKPEFARKPVVKNTFYRKMNILFPQDAAAEPRPIN